MKDEYIVSGELAEWPSKRDLQNILSNAGLNVVEGRFSIRVKSCEHFVFQHLESAPAINADAASESVALKDAAGVSGALSNANIRHRFEVFGPEKKLVGYFHHCWPR